MPEDLGTGADLDDELEENSDRVEVSGDGHHRLHVFCDLILEHGADRLDEFVGQLEQIVEDPWRRAAERDESPSGLSEWRVFERLADEELPGALLFLVPRDRDGALYVSNIVPTHGHSLGKDNYNAILAEFTDRYVRPVAAAIGLDVAFTDAWIDFADEIGEEAFDALRAAAVFKPGTHPSDRERWMQFIVLAHRRKLDVDLDRLRRWLEADGFAPERAYELMVEFEFGTQLLSLERKS